MVCPQKESFRMLIKFRIANIEEFVGSILKFV